MNSSLQCIMHAVPLMNTFLSGAYEADLNTANPLGLKGQLAQALASLMGNVWKVRSVACAAWRAHAGGERGVSLLHAAPCATAARRP
jgi:hypothetical protein